MTIIEMFLGCLAFLIMMIVGICLVCNVKNKSNKTAGIVLLAVGAGMLICSVAALAVCMMIKSSLDSCCNEIQACGRMG